MGCNFFVTLKSVPLQQCTFVSSEFNNGAAEAESHMKPSPYERKVLSTEQASSSTVGCESRWNDIVRNT